MTNPEGTTPAGSAPFERWVRRLRAWWQERARKRYWTPERQLEYLRIMILEDWRWLAHDKIADALTTRYKRACSASWYTLEHEPSSAFRRRVGLEPTNSLGRLNSPENVARLNRLAKGEPTYADGPFPERGWD